MWGAGLSIIVLLNFRFDALFFLILLLLIHVIVLAVAFWRGVKLLWRVAVWIAAASLLLFLIYLTRFSIGIYLLPSTGLILLAGVLTIAGNSIPDTWKAVDISSEAVCTPTVQINSGLRQLTPRELEVLLLLTSSKSNQEIADTLVISINTVRHHVQQILRKLNCSSRGEAAVIAKIAGLQSPENSED